MLRDTLNFEHVWARLYPKSPARRGIIQFIRFLERKLGARFQYDVAALPGDPELIDLFEIAERLRDGGIVSSYSRGFSLPDEPPLKKWYVGYGKTASSAGGMDAKSDYAALTRALAEAVERFLWADTMDYFNAPYLATAADMKHRKTILPQRFAGFSTAQRSTNPRLTLSPDQTYLWVKGYSWSQNKSVWVPAQTVSGMYGSRVFRRNIEEPVIIAPITTGLATGPTREFALRAGALEIIERDAFMIMWLNQVTPPRLDLGALSKDSPELLLMLDRFSRYRLTASVVLLPTDAPAYAVCGVIQDQTGNLPAITVGLKADSNLAKAACGALYEALRIRIMIRDRLKRPQKFPTPLKEDITHLERLEYWARPGYEKKLSFLLDGDTVHPSEPWDKDDEHELWKRILRWCRENKYECASVDLGASRKNVSPWHVQMVVIPELIPLHLNERYPYLDDTRRISVATQFGYTPLANAFNDEPHPFA